MDRRDRQYHFLEYHLIKVYLVALTVTAGAYTSNSPVLQLFFALAVSSRTTYIISL